MPFAGDASAAARATATLQALRVDAGDELILADNCGVAAVVEGVRVVPALGERSPAHARNVGSAEASAEWLLFLDADCRAPRTLLDDFFAAPIDADVAALAGEVVAVAEQDTLAARYAVARDFLGQRAHLSHPYLPRAVAANLLVRTDVFRQLGGFLEGLRAAEDTDFCWRLQRAGWRLELRSDARVEHVPRSSVNALRAQWRGYAAGRAWLSRRYPDFRPQPALARVLRRKRRGEQPHAARATSSGVAGGHERALFLALDVLLGLEELRGLASSNRPVQPAPPAPGDTVVIADRYPVTPAPGLPSARVEALRRSSAAARSGVPVVYAEDDGAAETVLALCRLLTRHPTRVRGQGSSRPPNLRRLAAMACRVHAVPAVRALPDPASRELAERLGALLDRDVDPL